jgi:hypothetical protein
MSRRRGLTIPKVRRSLYRSARILGDLQAVRTGRVSRRIARRGIGKRFGRTLMQGSFANATLETKSGEMEGEENPAPAACP